VGAVVVGFGGGGFFSEVGFWGFGVLVFFFFVFFLFFFFCFFFFFFFFLLRKVPSVSCS